MQRRGFLRLFGAAVTTPFLPAVGAAAPAAGGAQSALAVAVAHAQKFPVISVGGLCKRCNLSAKQAEAMIRELAARDLVKLVGPARNGTVRAASKIMIGDPWGIARTSQPRPQPQPGNARQGRRPAQQHSAETAGQVAPWLAHLHDLCRQRGMTLSPRCFAPL